MDCNKHEENKQEAYTMTQLAAIWGCQRHTIRKMINRGELKAFKLGKNWRISHPERIRYETQGIAAE